LACTKLNAITHGPTQRGLVNPVLFPSPDTTAWITIDRPSGRSQEKGTNDSTRIAYTEITLRRLRLGIARARSARMHPALTDASTSMRVTGRCADVGQIENPAGVGRMQPAFCVSPRG
jgi:hypothetical protein